MDEPTLNEQDSTPDISIELELMSKDDADNLYDMDKFFHYLKRYLIWIFILGIVLIGVGIAFIFIKVLSNYSIFDYSFLDIIYNILPGTLISTIGLILIFKFNADSYKLLDNITSESNALQGMREDNYRIQHVSTLCKNITDPDVREILEFALAMHLNGLVLDNNTIKTIFEELYKYYEFRANRPKG